MKHSADATGGSEQQIAALEIIRRESLRSGRSLRSILSLIRVSDPPTKSEQLLLAAVQVLQSPHAIMPHKSATMAEWRDQYPANVPRQAGST